VIDVDQIPKSITLVHWDWTFALLSVMLRLQGLCISLVGFVKKMSPSPSNVRLVKLTAESAVFCGGVNIALPGPILNVGPLSLLRFQTD
jgi:hypothetical protein